MSVFLLDFHFKTNIINVIIHLKRNGVYYHFNIGGYMILTYKECIEKYGSDYQIKKEMKAGKLFQKEKGYYSLQKSCSEIEMIITKFPRAIYTGESAYYYFGLTDVIPDKHYLATKRTDSRIKDENVRQVFVKDDIFEIGKTKMEYRGLIFSIYGQERLLVDLIRTKSKLPFDYYKEIIGSYRSRAESMDFFLIEEYASKFRTKKAIMNAIQLEIL